MGVCDGLLIRRYSCRLVAVAGGLLMTIGMFVSAFMTSLDWIIFTFGVVGGLGSGIQYTALFVAIGYNFERNVNLALGFAISGVGIGTFVFTPLFAYLMTVFPLEGLFICLAGFSLQSVVASVMFFPSFLEIKHKTKSRIVNKERKGADDDTQMSFCKTLEQMFKTVPFLILLLSTFVANFGTYIVYIHFANYTTHKGTSAMETALLLSVIGLCFGLSRILAGLLCNSKAIDEPILLFSTYAISGVSSLLLPTYSDTFTGQFVFAVIFGLYGGCLYAVINGITLRYLPLRDLGTAVGIELAVVGIAIMTGPPAIGLIIDATRNYDIGLVIAGLCLLLGAVLTLVAESCNNKRPQNNITSLNTELASLTVDIPAPSEDTDICEHTI
ncbi:monocarboxylate transporter 12-like isoform X2 [Argopecten irradians]|uniref:monocarboxylate transporter 12-like isoform X2 n=1 Tax=Argopecten irradians TaxID=31199 RepID=UPI00371F33F0